MNRLTPRRNAVCSGTIPAALFLCTLLALPARAEWLAGERTLMGTAVTVELWHEEPASGREILDAAFAEIRRLDLMMNPWNPASEMARINREAATADVATTAEIIAVVQRALHFSRLTDGAFDISFASVGQHYDYRAGTLPDADQLRSGRENIDYRAIEVDPDRRTIHFTRPGLQIDLGGIAKGYAVDRAVALLQDAGVAAAIVSAGGDSRILGDLGDRPRTVGIRHPRREGEYAVLIPLADTAISTSGDYERYFEADGVRHHHILDPKTGRSAREVQSASVLAARGIDSDALSTAVFVLGVQRGLELVNSLPGVDAIIIDGGGALHYSDELLRRTTPE